MADTGPLPDRLHALDALRGGALMLGVAFHASLSFLPGPQIWVVRDAADPLIAGFFVVSHMFRMTLFFMIAGFFGRMLLERRGTMGFLRNRAIRIALPLLVFWPIALAGIIAAFVWGAAAMNGGVLPTDGPPPPPLTLASFPLTHLWFLYLLMLFYVAALVLRGATRLVDRGGWIGRRIADPALASLAAHRGLVALLALPAFIVLIGMPDWIPSGGIPTPDTGLLPRTAGLVAYAAAFAFGWMLDRQPALLDRLRRDWPTHLLLAVIASAWLLWTRSGNLIWAPVADPGQRALLAGVFMVGSWSWTLGLTGIALRFLHAERPARRYVADASYWIYLIHLPVVMALQVLVFPLALPALAKFAIVIGGASLILFASYHLLVRHSFLGLWLNGRRVPWRSPTQAMEAKAA